jgi:signal transduction histidine kinase
VCRDAELIVEVADDGCGFDPASVADSGIGLAGMVERARLIGAQLAVATAPGAGTVVTLALPIGLTMTGRRQ